jgi:hyperosmotically inducible protein
MNRMLSAAALAVVVASPAAWGQDGPLRRAGRALDNAGKNVRYRVESEVAREQINAVERDLINRVSLRLSWDKQLATSAIQLEVGADGTAYLRGSVPAEAVKRRAVDLVENTVGVTRVVDELAIVKDVKVISAPATTGAVVVPPTPAPAPGVIISTPAPAGETKVIVKP